MPEFRRSQHSLKTQSSRRRIALGVAAGCVAFAAHAASGQIALPGKMAFPENITSTKDGTMYVGSLGQGGVVRIKPHGKIANQWIKPGSYGSRSTLGLLADEDTGILWVCSNDFSFVGIQGPNQVKGAYLKGFDLHTGKGKISVQLPGPKPLCNDIAIGPDGAAYITDTNQQHILRLPKGGDSLELWLDAPQVQPPENGPGLDGLAFGADGNMYVDTYGPGDLYRVDVTNGKSGNVTKLTPSRKLVLADAIRPLGGNAFLLVEGGGSLDKITVNGEQVAVATLQDGFDLPTGVAVVGQTAWVSEGQLGLIFNPAKIGQKPNLPFKVLAVPMK